MIKEETKGLLYSAFAAVLLFGYFFGTEWTGEEGFENVLQLIGMLGGLGLAWGLSQRYGKLHAGWMLLLITVGGVAVPLSVITLLLPEAPIGGGYIGGLTGTAVVPAMFFVILYEGVRKSSGAPDEEEPR